LGVRALRAAAVAARGDAGLLADVLRPLRLGPLAAGRGAGGE
jgi:hypothetical protein